MSEFLKHLRRKIHNQQSDNTMNNSVTSDYLNDRTTNLIVSSYIRKAERLLSYSLINHIPSDIQSITLAYIGDHFMLYRGSYEWQISNPTTIKSSKFEISKITYVIRLHPTDLCINLNILSMDSLPSPWQRVFIRFSIECQETNKKLIYNKEFSKRNLSTHNPMQLPLNDIKNSHSSKITIIISATILQIIGMQRFLRLHPKGNRNKLKEYKIYDEPYEIGKYWIEDLLIVEPLLNEIQNMENKQELFVKKLKLCCVMFNFNISSHKYYETAKEMKRKHLLQLIEYISQSKNCLCDTCLPVVVEMIGENLFRSLPPSIYKDFDPEQDEPCFYPSWAHLQFVYEFFYQFLLNAEVKLIRRYIDKRFVVNLISLFNSEDPRERDHLKLVLHRLYGRCMPFRAFIRKSLNNELYAVIYSNIKHNGIAELLEIFGSIINGFKVPLKTEHLLFLQNILIPMHKISFLAQFHEQLLNCILQFIEKDESLALSVIGGLLKCWPIVSSKKELLFLNELAQVLDVTSRQQLETIIGPLFHRISHVISSMNFQIAERALLIWNNDNMATFTSEHRKQILPIIYPSLEKNYYKHWNSCVKSMTLGIINVFKEMDGELYEKVAQHYKNKQKRYK